MFIPLDDLSEKTEAQRGQYYKDACTYLGVPEELNVLKWFWDDSKLGKRSLILYATRGATDIIRGNRSISTLDLIQKDGGGYVTFTAVGQDPTGRIERAIGVAHLEGKSGAAFENAIKKAQTEAGRRMTLQFAGGGFLDESELPIFETNIPQAASLAELAKGPVVAINDEPGKDVTVSTVQENLVNANPAVETPEQFSQRMEKMRNDAVASLSSNQLATPEAEAPVVRKTRKRKTANTVSLDAPISANVETAPLVEKSPNADILESRQTPTLESVPAVQPSAVPTPVSSVEAAAPAPAVPTPLIEGLPTADQLKDYRARLGKFANDVLPSGGMMPTADVGGVTQKLRKFASLQIGASDVMKATAEQWEDLMSFLDTYLASKGAAELVKYIDTAIGVK